MANQTLKYDSFACLNVSLSIDDVMQQVDSFIRNTFKEHDFNAQKQNICIDAVKYHFESSGQQLRTKACIDACIKLGIYYDDMLILAATAELLHNASLIHDDIQDQDQFRRGQPAVWKKYGSNIAICAGDLLISTAYGVLSGYSKTSLLPQLISTIHHQTKHAIEGQSLDIFFKNKKKLSIEQYTHIAKYKSGALLSLPVELALVAAERNDCIKLAKNACASFAVGYQIADDLEDEIIDSQRNNKLQSVNITFVLKELGCLNARQEAALMCHQYLNEATQYAIQLPSNSGDFLVNLAEKLKNKVKC